MAISTANAEAVNFGSVGRSELSDFECSGDMKFSYFILSWHSIKTSVFIVYLENQTFVFYLFEGCYIQNGRQAMFFSLQCEMML